MAESSPPSECPPEEESKNGSANDSAVDSDVVAPKQDAPVEHKHSYLVSARFETLKSEESLLESRQKRLEAEKYLHELMKDKAKITVLENVFNHCERLLDAEIRRVTEILNSSDDDATSKLWGSEEGPPPKMVRFSPQEHNVMHRYPMPPPPSLPPPPPVIPPTEDISATIDPKMKLTEKIRLLKSNQLLRQSFPNGAVQIYEKVYMPVTQFPHVKYAGRMIGTNGTTVKELHKEAKCRILVQGRGSLKSPQEEENLRGKDGYEHLDDDLYVLIEATGAEHEVRAKVQYAKLLVLEMANPSVDPLQVIEKHRNQRLQGIPIAMQFPSISLLQSFGTLGSPGFLPGMRPPPPQAFGQQPSHLQHHQQQQHLRSPLSAPVSSSSSYSAPSASFFSGPHKTFEAQNVIPVSQPAALVGLDWSLSKALGKRGMQGGQ